MEHINPVSAALKVISFVMNCVVKIAVDLPHVSVYIKTDPYNVCEGRRDLREEIQAVICIG